MTSSIRLWSNPIALALVCTVAAFGVAPSSAGAVACSTSAVTIGGTSATSCTNFEGNDRPDGVTGYTYLGTANEPAFSIVGGTALSGVTLTASNFLVTGTSGTFDLVFSGGPYTLDFGVVLKASTKFTLFEFDDLVLSTSPTSVSVLQSALFNKDGEGASAFAISHISLYGKPPSTPEVPAPGPLGLLGLGLAALALTRRRKG